MAERKVHGSSAIKIDRRYTVRDYMEWPEGERWELIHGVPYNMSPAPRVAHQRVVVNMVSSLEQHPYGAPCEVLVAPVDVFLSSDDDIESGDTVVQPDVIAVCDPDKLIEEGGEGRSGFHRRGRLAHDGVSGSQRKEAALRDARGRRVLDRQPAR